MISSYITLNITLKFEIYGFFLPSSPYLRLIYCLYNFELFFNVHDWPGTPYSGQKIKKKLYQKIQRKKLDIGHGGPFQDSIKFYALKIRKTALTPFFIGGTKLLYKIWLLIFPNGEVHIILNSRNLEICKHSSFFFNYLRNCLLNQTWNSEI